MKRLYELHNFRDATRRIISDANSVIDQYRAQGQSLTLRQLYYRFIAMDLFPESWIDEKYNARNGLAPNTKNTMKNYKRLGDIIGKGRLAGLISWHAIEDRTRSLRSLPHWDSPAEIVLSCAREYRVDWWEGQEFYVEVWVEKDALVGVFEGPCRGLDTPFFSCRGYGSLSELWAAGRRLRRHAREGREPVILSFKDHDPSGLDMTEDIERRLSLFAEKPVTVERIALNMDQVEEYDPPPNPAKMSDSRFAKYVERFGFDSWELDALEPNVLSKLIEEAVSKYVDFYLFEERKKEQEQGRELLRAVSDHWDEISEEYG